MLEKEEGKNEKPDIQSICDWRNLDCAVFCWVQRSRGSAYPYPAHDNASAAYCHTCSNRHTNADACATPDTDACR
jgi:hypothetical protein